MTKNEIIKIDGMICHHCIRAVETELEKLNIINYTVGIGSARVLYNDTIVSIKEITNTINASGYEVTETKQLN